MQISWAPEVEGVGPTLPRAPPLRRPMVIILTPVIWKMAAAAAVWTALTLRLQVMSQITNIRIAKENVSDRISQQRRKLIWS